MVGDTKMRRQLPVVLALVVGVVIALGAVALLGGGDDDKGDNGGGKQAAAKDSTPQVETGNVLEGPGKSFTLSYPDGWTKVDKADLKAVDGQQVAALKRTKDDGVFIVQKAGKLDTNLDTVGKQLKARLSKQIKGFKEVRSTKVQLPAGEALSYTFVRDGGAVQNLVVIPNGAATYTLNSVVKGDSSDAAREVAAMVRAFKAKG